MTAPLFFVLLSFGILLALLIWSTPKTDLILEKEPECGYSKIERFLASQGIATYRKEYKHKNLYPAHIIQAHTSLHVQKPENRKRAIELIEREIF